MNFKDYKDNDDLKKQMISAEKELTQAGVFNGEKERSYNDLELERALLLKFLHLQTQYIKVLYHKLKED